MYTVFGKEFLTVSREGASTAPMTYESDVRRYRQQAGLSQEALARQVGVSRQTVVNIEHGTNEPKVLLAMALAAALGVAINELFRRGLS